MEKKKTVKIIRRISTIMLLIAVPVQAVTVVFLAAEYFPFNVGELHEICGFTIFGLVIIHFIIFRKSLKSMLKSKSQE